MPNEYNHKWAIMGLDLGMITGCCQVHILGKRGPKHPDHTIVRHRAFEVPVNADVLPDPAQARIDESQRLSQVDHYLRYVAHVEYWSNEITRFRRHAVDWYDVHPAHTIVAIEDWAFTPDIKSLKRETFSSLILGSMLRAYQEARAEDYRMLGFGPAHVSLRYITPSDRAVVSDDALKGAGLFNLDTSKSKRGRAMRHANDATAVVIALGKKLNIPGLLAPYAGERRPEPFAPREFHYEREVIPHHHNNSALVADPADAWTPRMPKRNRSRGYANLPKHDDRRAEMKRILQANEDVIEVILSSAGKHISASSIRNLMSTEDMTVFWHTYRDRSKEWYRLKEGQRIPSQKLLRLCHESLGPDGMRRLREQGVL